MSGKLVTPGVLRTGAWGQAPGARRAGGLQRTPPSCACKGPSHRASQQAASPSPDALLARPAHLPVPPAGWAMGRRSRLGPQGCVGRVHSCRAGQGPAPGAEGGLATGLGAFVTGAHLQRELAAKPRARGIWGSWAVTCHPSLPLRCSFPRRSVAEAHPSSPSHRRPRKSTRTAGRGAGRVPRPQASSLQRWGDPVPPSPPPAPLSLQEARRSA